MYTLAREINSRIEIYHGIPILDVLIVIGYIFMMNQIDFLVHPKFQPLYIILNIITIVLLIKKTFTNPIRKGFQRIIYVIIQNRGVYECKGEE